MKTRQYVTAETLTDGATSDFGIGWFTDSYVVWCGLLAKKLPKIHTVNKWYLIINVL